MYYGLNRLKKSKMDKIGLKSQKSDEIAQNCDFRTDFAILTKLGAETKFLPHVQLSEAYWIYSHGLSSLWLLKSRFNS